MGISSRAYAANRGVSHAGVRQAIASSHITLSADGMIDPAIAEPDWQRNADPSKERKPVRSGSAICICRKQEPQRGGPAFRAEPG
jgi:hypothetical protein